ncbi:Translocon at the outer envelope membrane of chloroplasts 75-III [Heracleum sosnowskyi]|uniref:Translocon at the outer envelope membrane of chloroplasts 75-III n=1 Tax=Heracleum sosnowskyi TaxID=360622 RepID=A0AAD8N2J4_9APIA|nr:Translocon at the outer envelope membrane of chloroplasts 75-III [Heracleum sosnowskyi]
MIAGGTLIPLTPIFPRPHRTSSSSNTTKATFPASSRTPFIPNITTSSLSLKSHLPPMQNPNNAHNHNLNHNLTSKPKLSLPLNTPLALTAITIGSGIVLHFLAGIGGNSGGFFGGGGGGSGGSGGSGGGSFWSRLRSYFVANAKEDESSTEWDPHGLSGNVVLQLNKLSKGKKYKVSEVDFVDRLTSEIIDVDWINDIVSIRPNGIYTKAQIQKELDDLAACGMFETVDVESRTKPDGTIGVVISFVESSWSVKDRFKCINVGLMAPSSIEKDQMQMSERERMEFMTNQERDYKRRMEKARPCMLPESMHREVLSMLPEGKEVTARLLQKIRDKVLTWYHDNGYVCAQVQNFGNLHHRELVCEVDEGDITRVVVQFLDKLGNVCEGNTQYGVIKRQLPKSLQQGKVFNIKYGRQAMQNIHSLALFSTTEIVPSPDEKNGGGIVVEIKLREMEQKSADVTTEWSIVPGRGGRPTLASIQPGGTVSFEHKNIKGLNRSLGGSVRTSNFLNPQNELGFQIEYVHPYLDGLSSPRNRTLRTSCFSSSKMSPVFTGGPGMDEVPQVLVDRAGIKTNITENFTRQSKFSYGVVMEEIRTRDETSQICSNGHRPSGGLGVGPPTTLSGTGIDRMAFLQANITRDNTKFVNGAIVGERNVFQLDQGLFIGSKFPFFNRHQLTYTKFLQLKAVEEGAGKPPPPVLVLHGNYGGCVGDLPSYEAFTLGGPYSVRGYNMGELGAARNILEVATELRIPVRNTHVYAFAEHGNDLGSSKEVKGNPTEVYGRMGQGSSYGVGVKLGQVRAEYAIDHNTGTGAVFFRFGERF